MAIITKIQVQKVNKERFNIYTDDGGGEEFAFSVDADTLVKHNLKKGLQIEQYEIEEVLHSDQLRKAYLTSIVYLSRMMRTKKEVELKLEKLEISPDAIRLTLQRLEDEGYINEEQYTISYIRTCINTTLKGPIIIQKELKTKGISNGVIEKALKVYSTEKQVEHAIRLCEKKLSSLSRYSTLQKRNKLEELLSRKGYHSNVISISLQEVEFDNEEDEELQTLLQHATKLHRKYEKFSEWEYKQKMKSALFRKGFSIDLIERALDMLDEQLN